MAGVGSDLLGLVLPRKWRLTNADWAFMGPENPLAVQVQAQQENDEIHESGATDTNVTASFGDGRKGVLPGSTGPDSVQVSGEFQSWDVTHDIRPIARRLQQLRTPDPDLGRVPLVLFEWGHKSIEGWLTSLDITWEGGLHLTTGYPKRFRFEFTVTEFVDRPLDTLRQGQERSTNYHVLRGGETWEHLAALYVGDPRRSPLVRRLNPDVEEVEQARVKVLPRMHSQMRGQVLPVAPCLASGWEAVFERMAEARR